MITIRGTELKFYRNYNGENTFQKSPEQNEQYLYFYGRISKSPSLVVRKRSIRILSTSQEPGAEIVMSCLDYHY